MPPAPDPDVRRARSEEAESLTSLSRRAKSSWGYPPEAGPPPEIAHPWVEPDAHGQGVGRMLGQRAVAEAARRGWTALEIVSDPHAAVFYARMGAVPAGSVPAPMQGAPDRTLPRLRPPVVR